MTSRNSGSNTMVIERMSSSSILIGRKRAKKSKSKSSSIDEIARSIAQTAISARPKVKAKRRPATASKPVRTRRPATAANTKQTINVHLSTSAEEKRAAAKRYKRALETKVMTINDLPASRTNRSRKIFKIKKIVACVSGIVSYDFQDDEYTIDNAIRENIIMLKNGKMKNGTHGFKTAYPAIKQLQVKLDYDIYHTKKVKRSVKILIRVRKNPNNESADSEYINKDMLTAYLVESNIGVIWIWENAINSDKNKKALAKFKKAVGVISAADGKQQLTVDYTYRSNSTEEKQYQRYNTAVERRFISTMDIPNKNAIIRDIKKIMAKVSGITEVHKLKKKKYIVEQSVILKTPGKIKTLQKKLDNIIIHQIPGGKKKRFVINVRRTKRENTRFADSYPIENTAYLAFTNDGVVWIWESDAVKISNRLVKKFNRDIGYVSPKPVTRGYRLDESKETVVPACLLNGSHDCIDKVCHRRLLESIRLNKTKWTKPMLVEAILHYNENKRLNVNNRIETLSKDRLMGIIRNLKQCK